MFVLFCFYFTRFSVADFNNPLGENLENCSQLPFFVLFIHKHEQDKSKRKADNFRYLRNNEHTTKLNHNFELSEK